MSNIFAASKPTLTYFDLYGRGEAIRMALAHSKTEFEDSRVSGETWAAFKASGKCNNGQIPVLEVNGQALNQSEAIIRFVGSQVRPPPLAAATGCYRQPAPHQRVAAGASFSPHFPPAARAVPRAAHRLISCCVGHRLAATTQPTPSRCGRLTL
jgi:hypothetical protein